MCATGQRTLHPATPKTNLELEKRPRRVPIVLLVNLLQVETHPVFLPRMEALQVHHLVEVIRPPVEVLLLLGIHHQVETHPVFHQKVAKRPVRHQAKSKAPAHVRVAINQLSLPVHRRTTVKQSAAGRDISAILETVTNSTGVLTSTRMPRTSFSTSTVPPELSSMSGTAYVTGPMMHRLAKLLAVRVGEDDAPQAASPVNSRNLNRSRSRNLNRNLNRSLLHSNQWLRPSLPIPRCALERDSSETLLIATNSTAALTLSKTES